MAEEQQAPAPEAPSLDIEATVEDIASTLMPQEDEGEPAAPPPAEAAEPTEAEAEKAESEKAAGTVSTVPVGTVDTPPDTWRKEAKEAWAAVPPAVKEELRKRESDISNYVAGTKQPVAIGKKLMEVIQPHLAMFEATKTDPWENITAMFQVQERLLNGPPEVKLAIIQAFAKQAGVTLENGAVSAPPDALAQYVKQLEQKVTNMEAGVKSVTGVVQEARLAELQENVRRFAEDKAHPFFNDVADEITRLINVNAARDLEHAYQLACASDPVVRQKVVEAAIAQATGVKAAAEKERVAKARTTAKPRVRSTATSATPQPLGDIDSTLKDTLADIRSRA